MEKPVGLFKFLLVLEFISLLVNILASKLMAPLLPVMNKFAATVQLNQDQAYQDLRRFLTDPDSFSLILSYLSGFCLPFLFLCLAIMATSRVALGLWDGYEPGLGDIFFAIKKYVSSCVICFFISLYLLFLFVLGMITLMPLAIFSSLTKNPLMGGLLTIAGLVLSGLIFFQLTWPYLRRILCLQFIPFYVFLDGLWGQLRIRQIFARLDHFPRHASQGGISLILLAAIPNLILSALAMIIEPRGWMSFPFNALLQLIATLLLLWPMTALAGFYRLVLYPRPDEDPNKKEENGKIVEDKEENSDASERRN
jgi:hypothetical protein